MNGTLLIAGGNVGATPRGREAILGRFRDLLRGKKALVIVCASGDCRDSWSWNRQELIEAGIPSPVLLPLTEEPLLLQEKPWTDQPQEPALLSLFEGVGGVWFSGGDQLRIARLLLTEQGEDTPVLARIRRLLAHGGVVAGTSAGAAIMSRTMIVRGDDPGALTLPLYTDLSAYPAPDREESPEALLLLRGLGFLPGGIVDQHFNRRARLQRLLAAMEAAGEPLAFGISEDTALEVNLEDNRLQVHGSGYVLRLDREPGGAIRMEKLTGAAQAQQYRRNFEEEIQ